MDSVASTVYRNPPWIAGPEVLLASDVDRIADWPAKAIGIDRVLEFARGKGVRVGIADTGRSTHSDVQERIVASKNFSDSFSDEDFQGHGTHVAGIVGSSKLGLAPECEIISAKVLGDDGSGDNRAVARGFEYLLAQDCDIISASLGGGYDEYIHHAIKAAVEAGKFVIVAAGNDGYIAGRNTVGYPARLEETIAIGSYDRDGRLSKFSSHGREVDFVFPGGEILSNWLSNKYRRLSGTSMATPFAAALAACWLSYQSKAHLDNPIRSNKELRERWIECAVDKGPHGRDIGWGYGIVDAVKFLQRGVVPTTPPPSSPTPAPVDPPAGAESSIDLLAVLGLPGVMKLSGPITHRGESGYFLSIHRD